MALKFPSEPWIQKFGQVLNDSAEYNEAAKDWEGDVALILSPDPSRNIPEHIFYMDLWHGKCRSARELKSRDEVKAEILIEGPYDSWMEVIRREIDPMGAIMQGKLQVQGNMAKLMRNVQAPLAMVNCISEIETEFVY